MKSWKPTPQDLELAVVSRGQNLKKYKGGTYNIVFITLVIIFCSARFRHWTIILHIVLSCLELFVFDLLCWIWYDGGDNAIAMDFKARIHTLSRAWSSASIISLESTLPKKLLVSVYLVRKLGSFETCKWALEWLWTSIWPFQFFSI